MLRFEARLTRRARAHGSLPPVLGMAPARLSPGEQRRAGRGAAGQRPCVGFSADHVFSAMHGRQQKLVEHVQCRRGRWVSSGELSMLSFVVAQRGCGEKNSGSGRPQNLPKAAPGRMVFRPRGWEVTT